LLGDVNNLCFLISLLTTPSNVLPLHLKQTFRPIIWIFTEGEGYGIEFRLPFNFFSTLTENLQCASHCHHHHSTMHGCLINPVCLQWVSTKGQLFSEWIYEVIVSPKIGQKIVRISALCSECRNLDNFLFVLWKKHSEINWPLVRDSSLEKFHDLSKDLNVPWEITTNGKRRPVRPLKLYLGRL
jgi:hypothetical protein